MTQYFSKEDAYNLTFRAKENSFSRRKRSIHKRQCVLKGLFEVKEYLKDRSIEDLFYGRYAIEDAPLVFDVDGLKTKIFTRV